jgi:hypothetical protein
MSALIAGIAIHALVPHLHGRARLALATIPPLAFGVDAIGSGVLYLALRHSENPSTVLLHLGALTVVGGGALTVRLMAMFLPAGRGETGSADTTSSVAVVPSYHPETESVFVNR